MFEPRVLSRHWVWSIIRGIGLSGVVSLWAGLGAAWAIDSTEQPDKTWTDVAYGPHPRQVLDFWKAAGEGERPLLVSKPR